MKPILVVMAAGMGSRYGGLKQIDPIGPNGEVIIDYSLYDAKQAGFEKVVCIIKHQIEDDFKAVMNRGAAKHLDVQYAFQQIEDIPTGFAIPEGREKPWGTGHAILAAKDLCDAPFAVINADDYYGPGAFRSMFDYLSKAKDGETYDYCMAGYQIENTLTENGAVARGVCEEKDGYMSKINERKTVQKNGDAIQFTEDGGKTWTDIPEGTLVSMNMFGFTVGIMDELQQRFPAELKKIIAEDPIKGEFYIPKVVGALVDEGKAKVKVLPCKDKWQGVTYKEDKPVVVKAIKEKIAEGMYPEKLW